MLTVKILGSGCTIVKPGIQRTAGNKQPVHRAKVEKVTDHAEFAKYRSWRRPAGHQRKTGLGGRVPSEAEITTLLANALMAE